MMLLGCATTEESLQESGLPPLTQSELEVMYDRTRTMDWSNPKGASGTVTYNADGTAYVNRGGEQIDGLEDKRLTGRPGNVSRL